MFGWTTNRALLKRILKNQETTMATLDDIKAKQADEAAKIAELRTVEDSAVALLNSQKQTLLDLKAQLDAATAANDPAKLQEVADNIDAQVQAIEEGKAALASAVAANATP